MDILSHKINVGEKALNEYVIHNISNNAVNNRQADIDSLIEL